MLVQRLRGLSPGRWRWIDGVNLLAVVVAVLAGFFILTGTWIAVVLLALLAALGLDGVLRTHPLGRLRSREAALQQFLAPATFAVASALFFRWVATGYWGVAGAVLTGLCFGAIAYASYFALDARVSDAGLSRTVLVSAAYAGLFALLAVYYSFDLSQPAAALLAGVAGALFAVEIFREADLAPSDLFTYTFAAGIVLAQVRWAAGYVRLDGLLAAMLLLLIFYVGTGLVLAAVTRRLSQRVMAEFTAVGATGLLIVVIGRLVVGS